MKTDLKVLTSPTEFVLPSIPTEEKHEVTTSQNLKYAKIHRGFADVCRSVSEDLMTCVLQIVDINRIPSIYAVIHWVAHCPRSAVLT